MTFRLECWQYKSDQYFMPQSAAIMRRWTTLSFVAKIPLLSAQGSLIPRSRGKELPVDGNEGQNIEGNAYGIRVEERGKFGGDGRKWGVNIRNICGSKTQVKRVFKERSGRFLSITNLTHFLNVFIYFPLHVSSNPVLIIRRIELYQYIIWYIPGSHLHRVIYTRWCIDTIWFSWWWAWHARNM